MKIAMLGHKRVPSREGGVEVVVEELATRMAALGHDVTLYSRRGHNVAGSAYDDEAYQQDEYDYKGVHIKTVPTIDVKGLAAASSAYAATKAAIADKPDVIHFHAEGPSGMVAMAHRAGIRTVSTIHGLDWQRAKWGKLASGYLKSCEAKAAKSADEIIVLSRGVQRYFQDTYGRETHFIPNGVTMQRRLRANWITQEYGLTEGSYVLYVGRMVPEKGVHYLVDAYRQLATDKPLVLVGGNSDAQDYYNHIQELASADGRIIMCGFRQGDQLRELYSNAYLYVLPSDLEGMPMSLLEAMSYGRCCLTSDIPECADVLGESGIAFHRADVADLRDTLQKALGAPDTVERLGIQGRQRVESHFGWDNVVMQTLRLYDSVC